MKIKVNRKELLNGLQKVSNIVSDGIIPVLSNIVLQANGDKLTLISTDIKRRITTVINADVESDGVITLPASKIVQLFTKFDSDIVSFSPSKDGDRVIVKCGKRRGSWISLPIDDFPKKKDFDVLRKYKLKSKQLVNGLQKTIFASSKDTIQAVLQSVMLEFSEGNFKCVASDGKRISTVTDIVGDYVGTEQIVIPSNTASELNRILENSDEEIEIQIGGEQFDVIFGDTVLNSILINEKFIDYNKAIPESFSISVDIDRLELLNALEIIVIALESDKQPVYMNMSDNKIKLSASSNTIAEQEDEIDVEYSGEEIKMCFNACYLADALKVISSDKFQFKCNGSGQTILISDGQTFNYIFMPMIERG